MQEHFACSFPTSVQNYTAQKKSDEDVMQGVGVPGSLQIPVIPVN